MIEIVRFLVSCGAHVDIRNNRGETPLDNSAFHADIMEFLIDLTTLPSTNELVKQTQKFRKTTMDMEAIRSHIKQIGHEIDMRENQWSNDSNKPVHSYNRGVRLGVVPILSFGCGFMLLALACVFAYVEGVDWSTVAVGIFGLFFASIGLSLFIAPMLRCPSCKKDGAITWDEYMALSKLRDNIILHNRNNPSINDPVAAATAATRLLYRCKHCGYEWIYQYV